MTEQGVTRFPMLSLCMLLLAGCGGAGAASLSSALPGTAGTTLSANGPAASGGKIQHVIIIFQENRTPDNLFHGLPGADIANAGVNSKGQTVPLRRVHFTAGYDLDHSHNGRMFGGGFLTEYHRGAMNGFDLEAASCPSKQCPTTTAYAYVPPYEVQPYFQMAEEYTFGDRMFQSNAGPSFPAHQYILSGTSSVDGGPLFAAENPEYANWNPKNCDGDPYSSVAVINVATGVEAGRHGLCFDHRTLFDALDAKGVTYKYYTPQTGSWSGLWNAPDAIRHIRFGPDWSHVSTPNTNVLTDIAKHQLPAVSWVIPNAADSDHPLVNNGSGPSWVASIVNAVGTSPYWNSTAIIVTWDDWGGWYDHVKPPQYNPYELGFRVPLIVISPYAKRGYVSHVQHDFGSILRFTEEQFGLRPLGYADTRADDLADCFSYTQTPGPFSLIKAPENAAYFLSLPQSNVPVDNDF